MKISLILQARFGSARLPGKVLKKINDEAVLEFIFKRIARSQKINNFIVATTINDADNDIVDICIKNNIKYFRGSENNVLDRFYQTALISDTDIVIMCTGDCPLIDPIIIDDMINIFIDKNYEHFAHKYYGGNMGFPDGFDVNIIKFEALKKEWLKNKDENIAIEHACSHLLKIYGNGSHIIPTVKYNNLQLEKLHLSLDTDNDFILIKHIINNIRKNFTVFDVLEYLNNNTHLLTESQIFIDNYHGKGQELYKEAKKMIPGGTQLLSKRPEMFLPDLWPAYYQQANGIEITTLDGTKMKDFVYMGIGSCILGYKDIDINAAVKSAVDRGNISTLNCPSEVTLTKLFIDLHPWADMARYCRSGGEATTIAIRIARASSKKDKVAFCGYHGWHDWYLSANWNNNDDKLSEHLLTGLSPIGVPKNLKNTAFPFKYNDIDSLIDILENHDIGTIIMEPQRSEPPKNNFLHKIRDICDKKNIILIFDEISSGFRLNSGGLHLILNVIPDVAIFAKAISNGYPMGAIIGRKEIMLAAEDTFISSTYWTEDIGYSAAIATIKKHIKYKVGYHIRELGIYFQSELRKIADDICIKLTISGLPCFSAFNFDYENGNAIKTLYIQEMLKRNILAKNVLYLSYAHKKSDIDYYLENIKEVFILLNRLIDTNKIEKHLLGPEAHTGFKRLN